MAERDIIARIVVEGGQQAATQLDNVAKSEREIVAATKEANTALNTQNQQLSENTAATKGAVGAQESLKKQLRDLKAELARLAVEGKKNTEEYRRLREEAGQLDDAIRDVNAEIAQAGSDTRGIDNVIRVAGVAAAGFGVLEGATALFGDQNEELQKTLIRVTGAMTLLTSIQSISNELTKGDSIFKLAAAKANLLYQAAIAGATGATKAFRIALIATGIGAIVVSIGLLVANWDKLSRAITRSFPRLADFGEAVQKVIQKVTDLLGLTSAEERARNASVKALEAEIKELERKAELAEAEGRNIDAAQKRLDIANKQVELLKAEGAAQEDLADAKNDVKIAQANLTNAISEANKENEKSKKNDEERLGLLGKLKKELEDVTKKIALIDTNTDFNVVERLFGQQADLQNRINSIQRLFDITELLKQTELINPESINNIDDLKNAISLVDAALFKLDQNAPQRSGLLRLFTQLNNKLNFVETNLNNTKAALAENGQTAQDVVDKAIQAVIAAGPKVVEKQEQAILNIPLARAKALKREINILKANNKDVTKEEQQLQDTRFQIAQNAANKAFEFFTQIQNARLAILQNRLDQGLISEEEYNKEVAKINRQQAIADKTKALFDIALNTAVGISAALRAVPPNPALAALYGVLGAIQAGIVLATPIPKFRYGGQVLGGGSISPEGMLSGRSHAGGGMLIEAEGGEFITRKEMTKKYLPILKAINQDKLGDVLYPKIPIMRTFGSVASQSQRKADKRMEMLIEEVQFMSQYIRQGNKYARVTADNTSNLKTSKKHHRV